MSLAERLKRRIAAEGPITVAAYMAACLGDPQHGYYARHPRLGAEGDFITAPHVSQMFGEILGLWAAEVWRQLGSPSRVRLIELGPGDGTMLTDVLRAARAVPGFGNALDLRLIETSAPLRARQAEAVASAGAQAQWLEDLAPLAREKGPVVALANEFLDCLPIRQYVRAADGWCERRVGVSGGALAFMLTPLPSGARAPATANGAAEGAVLEQSEPLAAFGAQIGALIAAKGGAALFVDYGRTHFDGADTLQAVRLHRREDPLANPGEADLTAHADFAAFLEAAKAAGVCCPPPMAQADFLHALGIETRAAALIAAQPARAELIGRQLERLTAPDQMGEIFKVACVHSPGLSPPPFRCSSR
ncbi:MAG TPA: SAM-dependent methyltransferase [Caulobacteraceae bacterium]|nr:SAM-dependent methyltransferase [Caulobacteraceae bacterium]